MRTFFILQKNKKLARELLYKKARDAKSKKIKMCRNSIMEDKERRNDDWINHCNTWELEY